GAGDGERERVVVDLLAIEFEQLLIGVARPRHNAVGCVQHQPSHGRRDDLMITDRGRIEGVTIGARLAAINGDEGIVIDAESDIRYEWLAGTDAGGETVLAVEAIA